MRELSYYECSISGRGYQGLGIINRCVGIIESDLRLWGICDTDSQRSLITRPNQSSQSETGSAKLN